MAKPTMCAIYILGYSIKFWDLHVHIVWVVLNQEGAYMQWQQFSCLNKKSKYGRLSQEGDGQCVDMLLRM